MPLWGYILDLSTPTLRRIAELEAERSQLYARTSQRWLNDLERGRLIDIRQELDRAWERRRAEKASASVEHTITIVRSPASWDNRRGPRLPRAHTPLLTREA